MQIIIIIISSSSSSSSSGSSGGGGGGGGGGGSSSSVRNSFNSVAFLWMSGHSLNPALRSPSHEQTFRLSAVTLHVL
jgi:hypothetical protein